MTDTEPTTEFLIKHLRDDWSDGPGDTMEIVADRLEALQAECERLREALRKSGCDFCDPLGE